MTNSEVAKLVAMLLQAYPQAQFGPASSAMYERMLVQLDAAAALAAVEQIIRTSKFMPTISEIREAAALQMHGPKRLGAEAWADVNKAVRFVGSYNPPPKFEDPIVGRCVAMMGWESLCRSTNDAADRARFIDLYEGIVDREWVETLAHPRLEAPHRDPVLELPRTGGLKLIGRS